MTMTTTLMKMTLLLIIMMMRKIMMMMMMMMTMMMIERKAGEAEPACKVWKWQKPQMKVGINPGSWWWSWWWWWTIIDGVCEDKGGCGDDDGGVDVNDDSDDDGGDIYCPPKLQRKGACILNDCAWRVSMKIVHIVGRHESGICCADDAFSSVKIWKPQIAIVSKNDKYEVWWGWSFDQLIAGILTLLIKYCPCNGKTSLYFCISCFCKCFNFKAFTQNKTKSGFTIFG